MPGIYGDGSFFEGYCHSPGTPGFNVLRMEEGGAPPNVGDWVKFTDGTNTDTYEFRDSSPPSGGGVGNILIYRGMTDTAARTNLVDAINNDSDVNRVTYPGTGPTLSLRAKSAGVDGKDIHFWTAVSPGGLPAGTAAQIDVTKSFAAGTYTLDSTALFGALPSNLGRMSIAMVTITAAMITRGNVEVPFTFSSGRMICVNMMRPMHEAWSIVQNSVYSSCLINLHGGADPNTQPNDILMILAIETYYSP